MSKGHLMVDGHRFEVADIRLQGGGFFIVARAPGPLPPMAHTPITIFGADGLGVGQGDPGDFSFPGCRRGETGEISVAMKFTHLHGVPAP